MRQLIAIVLLALVAGCDLDRGTDPAAMAISLRLRDDAGESAGRNQVIMTDAASTRVIGSTRTDGTTEFPVDVPGSYWVQVVPRNGYRWSAALRREVVVAGPGSTMVEFTLYREAILDIDPTGRAPR